MSLANGYDLRIDIADRTDWEVTPNVKSEPDRAALSREVGSTDGLGIAPGKERDAQT